MFSQNLNRLWSLEIKVLLSVHLLHAGAIVNHPGASGHLWVIHHRFGVKPLQKSKKSSHIYVGTWSALSWPPHDLDQHMTSSWVHVVIGGVWHRNVDDETIVRIMEIHNDDKAHMISLSLHNHHISKRLT